MRKQKILILQVSVFYKRLKSMESSEPPQPPIDTAKFDEIRSLVAAEFTVEEGFMEFNTPTFYVAAQPNLKQAFLRVYQKLDSMQFVPVLRKRENRITLQVVPKPPVKPNRPWVNLLLLAATIGTTLLTGYLLSEGSPDPLIGAVLFSAALLSILAAHEMGHKLTANRHRMEATYPYFIPGIPPFFPTFGAVIQQKSLPPNKDALFDLGISGPLVGFFVTIIVTVMGVQMSVLLPEPPAGSVFLPTPLLFDLLSFLFPPPGSGAVLLVHPVALAGYIGMIVTMLNLLPVGQFDGGHVAHVLLGERSRTVVSIVAMVLMLFISWPMAIIALLISRIRHPAPLDDVSKLSAGRKLAAIALVVIFVLSVAPVAPLF